MDAYAQPHARTDSTPLLGTQGTLTGKELFDLVTSQFGLHEKQYFGLEYRDESTYAGLLLLLLLFLLSLLLVLLLAVAGGLAVIAVAAATSQYAVFL